MSGENNQKEKVLQSKQKPYLCMHADVDADGTVTSIIVKVWSNTSFYSTHLNQYISLIKCKNTRTSSQTLFFKDRVCVSNECLTGKM